jgi:hypothetical protein
MNIGSAKHAQHAQHDQRHRVDAVPAGQLDDDRLAGKRGRTEHGEQQARPRAARDATQRWRWYSS